MATKRTGRKVPEHLKVLTGNPGKRPPKVPPKLPAGIPEPPEWLPEQAVAHYRRLAPPLAEAGLLAEVDRDALADYCLCLVRLQEAERLLSDQGPVVSSSQGPKKNPAATLAKEYRQAAQAWAKRFGLDPASRGVLDVKPPEEPDEMEALLERR